MYLNLYTYILERKTLYSTFNSCQSLTHFLKVVVYNESQKKMPEHFGEDQVLHLLQNISLGSMGNATEAAHNLSWGPLETGGR